MPTIEIGAQEVESGPTGRTGTRPIRIDAKDLEFEIGARVGRVGKALRDATVDGALATMPHVVQETPVDRGEMAAAWAVKPYTSSSPTELRNDAPHAGIIERGTRPFWPPFEPLYEWAKRKAGDLALAGVVSIHAGAFSESGGKKRFRGSAALNDDDDKAIRQFVFAVRAKIAREGLKPHFVMLHNIPVATEELKKAIDAHLAKQADKPAGNAT